QPGSPSAKAGLREGDRIIEVNGQPAGGLIEFNRKACALPAHNMTLRVQRGEDRSISIPITMTPFFDMIRNKLGLSLREVSQKDTAGTGFPTGTGLRIDAVGKGGTEEMTER